MANPKEKVFAFHFKTNEPTKLHKFIEECSKTENDRKKYLFWSRYLPNFYTLATLENTYWDINKLTKSIYNHMDKNINFIIFEIQNVPAQGRMEGDFWNIWKQSQNVTEYFKNASRAKKLKKIQAYINKKTELQEKEQEYKRRKIELKKSLSLKKREDELKIQELELVKMEEELNHKKVEVEKSEPKKRKWWF